MLSDSSLMTENTLTELSDIVNEYPFFQMGWILLLKNLHNIDSIKFQSELRRASVHVNSRETLYKIINEKLKEKVATVHPSDNVATATDNDYFANVPDELTYDNYPIYELSDESESSNQIEPHTNNDIQHRRNLIDNFLSQTDHRIVANAEQTQTAQSNQAENSDSENDDILTETLASIYIKQKQYAKAITIFKKLSLKNPEKSIYFATRIKELEKLNV